MDRKAEQYPIFLDALDTLDTREALPDPDEIIFVKKRAPGRVPVMAIVSALIYNIVILPTLVNPNLDIATKTAVIGTEIAGITALGYAIFRGEK